MLTRDELLAKKHFEAVKISFGEVCVRALSWSDFQKFRQIEADESGTDEAELVVLCGLADLNGDRLLTDEDIDFVRRMPGGDFAKIVDAVRKVSGQGDDLAEEVDQAENE